MCRCRPTTRRRNTNMYIQHKARTRLKSKILRSPCLSMAMPIYVVSCLKDNVRYRNNVRLTVASQPPLHHGGEEESRFNRTICVVDRQDGRRLMVLYEEECPLEWGSNIILTSLPLGSTDYLSSYTLVCLCHESGLRVFSWPIPTSGRGYFSFHHFPRMASDSDTFWHSSFVIMACTPITVIEAMALQLAPGADLSGCDSELCRSAISDTHFDWNECTSYHMRSHFRNSPYLHKLEITQHW